MSESNTTGASADRVRVGCAGLPMHTKRSRYFERLGYLETPVTFYDPPNAATLRRWRRETPPEASYGVQAWQLITHEYHPPRGYPRLKRAMPKDQLRLGGSFRDNPVVAAAVTETAAAAEALAADVVLFRTPPEFAPSATNRDRMRRFFAEVAGAERFGNARRVWEPQGLWEPQAASAFAAELGILYAADPLPTDPLAPGPDFFASLPDDAAYFRITGLGSARNRIDEWNLETLAEIVGAYARAWVVFANVAMFADATRFAKMVERGAALEPDDGADDNDD